MFQEHTVDVGDVLVPGDNVLAIRCRALTPELATQRRPRARWRTRLVADNNLRWFRTMLLGRIPSFSPRPAAVGPWRPITLERRSGVIVEDLRLRPRLDGDDGVLAVTVDSGSSVASARRPSMSSSTAPATRRRRRADRSRSTDRDGTGLDRGQRGGPGRGRRAVVAAYPRSACPYGVRLEVAGSTGGETIEGGRIGFRTLTAAHAPTTTSNGTVCSSTSTVFRCSPAAPCGRRSISSASLRRPGRSARPSRSSGTRA